MTRNKENRRPIFNIHLLKQIVHYHLNASFWRGYGVHSPFVYHIVRHIITTRKKDQYTNALARTYRDYMLKNKTLIDVTDYGTGLSRNQQRCVRNIAKKAAISNKYGLMLNRLVRDLKPRYIVELGTSLGISTQYIARAMEDGAKMITIEGCPNCSAIAKQRFDDEGINDVSFVVGNFDKVLPDILSQEDVPDFFYVDGNHTYEATMRYFNMIAEKSSSRTVIVFDDIHWSKGMTTAWSEIVADERVMTSIDLLQVGIVFFRDGCQKEFFRVRW